MRLPFQCNRCHAYGNLIPECTLPFSNKLFFVPKTKVVWRVKKEWSIFGESVGFDQGVGLVDLSSFSDCKTDFGSEPVSLDSLKPLCVLLEGVGPSALSKTLGGCESDLPLSKSGFALGKLGFADLLLLLKL